MKNVLKIKNPETGEFEPIAAISGANGQGVPTGGTAGQVLKKTGSGDYETGWSDSAGDSEKLGGVAAAQYALKNGVPAHNLLDNSDFRNPVNQRNSAYYTNGNEYTIDRWKTQYGTNISIENGYINIWGNWDLKQRLKKPLGIIYTLAAKVRINFTGDNTPAVGIDGGQKVEFDAPIGEWRIYAKQIDISSITDETIEIQLAPNGGSSSGSISVEWVALYEGAYTVDTLPAYQPKGYAAELAECQRYFQRISNSAAYGIISGTGCVVKVPLPTTMRNGIVPTVTLDSAAWVYTHEGYVGLTFIGTTYSTNTASLHFTLETETSARCCVVPDLSFNISSDL